jgi:hypothetical protein
MSKKISITNATDIAVVEEVKPIFREKTAAKAAGRLLRMGRKALATAINEPDPDRRRRLLTQLGFD